MPTPPDATTGRRGDGQQLARSTSRSGPAAGAVDVDLGDHRAPPRPRPRSSGSTSATSAPDALLPAADRDLAAADVEPDRHRPPAAPAGRPARDRSTAAVPITTRATPASARARRRVEVAHPTTGLHRARRRRRRSRPPPARLTGSPVRAASRSTTWIHAAPVVGEAAGPGPPDRRRRRSRGRSRPGRAARSGPPRRSMAG